MKTTTVMLLLLIATPAFAQPMPLPPNDTRDPTSSWQIDPKSGKLTGTGRDMGGGWDPDGRGGWIGTGKNMGKRCISNNTGGLRCRP